LEEREKCGRSPHFSVMDGPRSCSVQQTWSTATALAAPVGATEDAEIEDSGAIYAGGG
jgi:hypothetical protein